MNKQDRVELFIKKAKNDYKTACVLDSDNEDFTDSIVFHCQQSIEKYLKAYLVKNDLSFPKTHDIDHLLSIAVQKDSEFELFQEISLLFSEYAVEIRYENVFIERSDVSEALKQTQLFIDFIGKRLA